jgi:hypothetical protein
MPVLLLSGLINAIVVLVKFHTKSCPVTGPLCRKYGKSPLYPLGMVVAKPGAGRLSTMKLAYSSKKNGGYLLAFFLLFGVITVASSSAQAQYPWGYERDRRDDRWDRRNDRYRDRNYGYQAARQQGYSYGMRVGAADAQRGQSYNPQRSRYWKNATEGYSSSYGNRGQYKQIFRNAFEQGYREGFQRYGYNRRGRWDNRWPR